MASVIEAIDVKRKMFFEFEDTPYVCLDVERSTPTARGGQTLVRVKMRNLKTRAVFDKTFKAGREVQGTGPRPVARHLPVHATPSGPTSWTRRATRPSRCARTCSATRSTFSWTARSSQILLFNGHAIGLQLPQHVELTVASTEAGARGDTASGNVTKVARLETGIEVRVSLFIKEGEKVKINTETRECLGRV